MALVTLNEARGLWTKTHRSSMRTCLTCGGPSDVVSGREAEAFRAGGEPVPVFVRARKCAEAGCGAVSESVELPRALLGAVFASRNEAVLS